MIDRERAIEAAIAAAYEENGRREVSYTVEALIHAAVDAILALPVRVTEDMVERGAAAGWRRHVEAGYGYALSSWQELDDGLREIWLADTRAALEAALNPEPGA